MLLVDTVQGRVIDDNELKEIMQKQPYGEWLDSNLVQLKDIKIPNQKVDRVYGKERAKTAESFWIYL